MRVIKSLSRVLNFFVPAAIIYALINLIHLSWKIAEPEGFWGFLYFIEIFGIVILALFVAFFVVLFLLSSLTTLFSDFPKKFTLKNILKPLGICLLVIVIVFINTITGSGISIYIDKKIADRYSYVDKSEKLLNEGKFSKALGDSKKAYKKYGEIYVPSKFFFLSRLFYKSDYGIKSALTKQYAVTINYAFCLDKSQTNPDLAERLYKDALGLADSLVLKDDPGYKIFPFLSLADLYLNKGLYSEAESYFNQLLQFVNKSSKDDVEFICLSQETFASYFLQAGNFDKARMMRENNLVFWEEKNQSSKSLQYLVMLLSAASIEIITGNFEKAGEYLVKAKPLAEKRSETVAYPVFLLMKGLYCNYVSINGKGNEEIIEKGWSEKLSTLFKKGKSLSEKFKSEAEACFLDVLRIEKNSNGDKSIGYAEGLHRLASFYIEQGGYIKANEILKEAKLICEKYKSSNIQLYYTILLAFTVSEYSLRGYESVKANLDDLEQYHFNKLIANYSFLTERERETYKNIVDNTSSTINSLYIATNTPETRERLYNNIIATKEIALYANENIRANLAKIDEPLQMEYYSIIRQRDSVENKKSYATPGFDQFANDILLKEKEIQKRINSLPGFTQFDPRAVNWKNVSAALKKNQVAIEFIHTKVSTLVPYYALLIKKDQPTPELIYLFEETTLKNLLNQPGNTESRINAIYGNWKDSLYSLIWKPIEEKVPDIDKAYISVSGILHGVSFPAVLNDKNLDVVMLGSTRQILSQDYEKQYSTAVLIGDVNYGQNQNQNDKPERSNYPNLPFAAREIQNIEAIFSSRRPPIITKLIIKDLATEKQFYNLEKVRPDIIHLATHGYYYPGTNSGVSNFLTEAYSRTDLSPMLRSGIVLAGANINSNSSADNDGFLSAQEIARMNLPGVDLAVLSACETGLGETMGSEGVFGLQRAFKLAGTRSLIMSLWKVPDEQTAELMRYFYDNYLNRGKSKSLALKDAQNRIKMNEKYRSPFYWGGFILLER